MRRLVVSLSVVAVLLLGVVATLGRGATAQDATPDTSADADQPDAPMMATHPIVGTWRWDNDPADPADDSYGIFAADGSYLEVTKPTNVGIGIGSWIPTGDRTADVITVFQDVDPSETFEPGTATFLMSATVDASGDELAATTDLQTRDVAGAVTFEASGWTLTASRVTVGPLPDFGAWQESTPVAGTPAP
jgi:hypothetical protein